MKLLESIGNTPLVNLERIWDPDQSGVRVQVKLEGANPGGSLKDRPACFMIQEAIKSGALKPGQTILEPTSGNTGIGMAMVAANLGYRIKLTMPACVSEERRAILLALGAELELTPGCDRTDGAIVRARHIMENSHGEYFMPDQFRNEHNWRAHFATTAPEIWSQTAGELTALVAGMGTTGTLMGCARYLKSQSDQVLVIGVEPDLGHRIQGLKNMRESIVPDIYQPELLSGIVPCNDADAFNTTRDLALREGIFCGISSGAAVWGAMTVARDLPRGSTVVAILPDRGDRYLSSQVFASKCAICPP
ncbi:PLP-dependent cysteine synthase family protein [Desulfurivibrio sp. D14AmB]|uniref:PLP-dependent cysteine synthase family protein n=1 Tax=Desulfurivibrio sp. D14AmB TaxID=3374370 RepID=UPI00376ECC87